MRSKCSFQKCRQRTSACNDFVDAIYFCVNKFADVQHRKGSLPEFDHELDVWYAAGHDVTTLRHCLRHAILLQKHSACSLSSQDYRPQQQFHLQMQQQGKACKSDVTIRNGPILYCTYQHSHIPLRAE